MNLPLWFSNLAFWSVQVAILTLAGGVLVQLLRLRQPRVLFVLWRALLAVNLLLPLIEPWRRAQNLPAPSLVADAALVHALPVRGPALSSWHFSGFLVAQILGLVILTGIAVRLVILALGLLRLRQFRHVSSPLPIEIDSEDALERMCVLVGARAEFRLSTRVVSPVTFGLARPVILFPERFLHLEQRFQSAIACHELLHVRRDDWAQHFAEELLSAVLWFHPAVAWLIARVRLAREQLVDLEVVRITDSRKPYVQALLEFTSGRGHIAAIPAPPFLAEQQLSERVALILKEVRMSRKKLTISLATISCALALVAILSAWALPLKAKPRVAQDEPVAGIPQATGDANEPTVNSSGLWLDTVKRSAIVFNVRALGKLVRADGSASLLARVDIAEVQAIDIKVGQPADVDTKHGVVGGHVVSLSPHIELGMRSVDIAFDAPLAKEAAVDDPIEGTIEVGRAENVLVVSRPIHATANSQIPLFKIVDDGSEAEKVNVRVGRVSVSKIEVSQGLNPGDTIILSDMSQWEKFDRVQLKPPMHTQKSRN